MGIDNREYLKDDDGYNAYRDPGLRAGRMSMVSRIILATVAMFVLQLMTSRQGGSSLVMEWLSLDSQTLFRQGQIWRLLTYAFCHSQGELLHIVMNMYILYVTGQAVSELTGEREFLWYYLASAVFAGICSVAFYSVVGLPFDIIGASGAVLAVFMLFAMYYPRRRMFLFGVIPIEVRWLLALYVALDAIPAFAMLTGDAQAMAERARLQGQSLTAHSAHLGGLLFGFLYFRWNMRLTQWWDQFAGRLPSLSRRRNRLKVFNPGSQPEPDMSHKVDEILAKISREGEASLTTRERNILTQASRQLRKDRP